MVAVGAFLEERDLMLEVFKKCLDFMSFMDAYWQSHRDNGERAPQTVVAQGRLFGALHQARKDNLRKRILEVREKLDKAERRYGHVLKGENR